MTDTTNTATRRGVLAALAGTAAFAGTIGAAIAAAPAEAAGTPKPGTAAFDDPFEKGRELGEEIALYSMARAWIDRWKACGGDFSGHFEDGSLVIGYYMGESYVWTPTDRGNPELPPHAWLVEQRHHDGAVKALTGLLDLVPELRKAIREIVGVSCLALAARAQEA